jgi:hypothetical protein
MAAAKKWVIGAWPLLALLLLQIAQAQGPPDPETIRGWIRSLDAEKFDDREAAAAKLTAAGAASIDPLVESLRGASRERMARGLSILVNLALRGDAASQPRAEAAVESIATSGDPRAARIAAGSLDSILRARADQARDNLITLGATLSGLRIADLNGPWRLTDDTEFVEIGPNFRGTLKELSLLKRLTETESLTLSLPTATDEWLIAIVENMPQLRELNIKRAKITSTGLAKLKQLKRLNHVWICYTPLDEKGAGELAELPNLNYLTLFGTGASKKVEDDLRLKLPNTKVEVRQGAFLGLGGPPGGRTFRVTSISPGSAAEKAGLKVDDVLLTVEGIAVGNINDLTEILKARAAGEKVKIEYLSDDGPKSIEVTLGEWP